MERSFPLCSKQQRGVGVSPKRCWANSSAFMIPGKDFWISKAHTAAAAQAQDPSVQWLALTHSLPNQGRSSWLCLGSSWLNDSTGQLQIQHGLQHTLSFHHEPLMAKASAVTEQVRRARPLSARGAVPHTTVWSQRSQAPCPGSRSCSA